MAGQWYTETDGSAWTVDARNNRCYMLPSSLLHIEHANALGFWSWIDLPDSNRCSQCAELIQVHFLAVIGEILTSKLCPGMTYEVYLVYTLANGAVGLSGVQMSSLRLHGERTLTTNTVCVDPTSAATAHVDFRPTPTRPDGWMEVKLAQFCVDQLMLMENKVIVNFREENVAVLKKGLIIEGMEFRPVYTN